MVKLLLTTKTSAREPARIRGIHGDAGMRFRGNIHTLMRPGGVTLKETVLRPHVAIQVILSPSLRHETGESVEVSYRVFVQQNPAVFAPWRAFACTYVITRLICLAQKLLATAHQLRGVLEFPNN